MALRVERVGPPSTARERLSGRTAPVGVRSGLPARGLLLFGLPFVAAGALVTLVGTRTIPVDDSTVHAPYWVLTVVGVCFALAGLVLWSRALAQARANARAARARRDHPDDPARIDYDWSPDGVRADRWRRVWPGLFGAAFVTLFLSAFNWWAFGAGAPWPVVAGVVLLDVAIAIAWIATLRRIWHGLKFGDSMLRFDAFPFTPPGPVSIRWVPPNGVVTASSGRFTLR